MTLEEAIEEVKLRAVNGVYWPGAHGRAELAEAILNAVASGQLVPVQCCMCGKKGLSTEEDGGPECELSDGRWVCSSECWEQASEPVPKADADLAVAEALRKAGEFVAGHAAVCRGQISPLSQKSDPPLTKAGASAVADRNAKLRTDADRFDLLAAAISGFANHDHLAEVQALRAEREALLALRSAIAVKGGSEHYPTEEAYLLACAAIEKHRARAAAAEAEVARLKAALQEIADMDGLQDWQPEAAACVNIARAALTKGDTP